MASNLTLRLISAAVLIPVVIGALYMGGIVFDIFVLSAFVLSVMEWRTISAALSPRLAYLAGGIVYLLVSLFLFDQIRDGEDGFYMTVTLMVVVWASDTMAYIFGRAIGGPKLAPAISPNKTWAGFVGSMIGAAILMCGFILYRDSGASLALLIIWGALLGAVGQAGDLLESHMKRKANVKDSGTIIPGHGGILDRIDALLMATPVFFLICHYGL